MLEIKVGQIWEHFKNKQYKIIAIAKDDNLQEYVVYEALYDNPVSKVWIRTKENFTDNIIKDGKEIPRFSLIMTYSPD